MDGMGDIHKSVKRYWSGFEEKIDVWEKASFLLLFEKQSMQDNGFYKESESGKEKLDTMVFRMGKEGCPSLESQALTDVFTVGVAK